MANNLATIVFQSEAYDSAANILRQLKGFTVSVVTTRAGDGFDAELVDVIVGEDGQYKARLAPWDEEKDEGDHSKIVTLDIYDDIERLEVV